MARGLAVALAVAAAFALSASAAQPPTKAPNIILILADDLGAGDVKCFNPAGKIATPHLDALARRGMMLTEAHSIDGSFGIRSGNWKLEFCPGSGGWSFPRPGRDKTDGMPPFQLFDLAKDPTETTNGNGRSPPGAPQANTPVKNWPQVVWMAEFK